MVDPPPDLFTKHLSGAEAVNREPGQGLGARQMPRGQTRPGSQAKGLPVGAARAPLGAARALQGAARTPLGAARTPQGAARAPL